MIGARPDEIIISRYVLVSVLDAITLVLRDGIERTLRAHIRAPGGIVYRRLIIHPFSSRELIVSAKPVR